MHQKSEEGWYLYFLHLHESVSIGMAVRKARDDWHPRIPRKNLMQGIAHRKGLKKPYYCKKCDHYSFSWKDFKSHMLFFHYKVIR